MGDEFQLDSFLTETGELEVRVIGELDMATSDKLLDAVVEWPEPVSACVVDLSRCSFLDSSGIRALLLARRHLDDGDGTLRLVGVSPHVDRVLRIAGVHEVIDIGLVDEQVVADAPD